MGLLPLSITTTAHQLHCHGVKLVPPFPLPSLTYRRHHRPHLPLPFPSAPASSASFPRFCFTPRSSRCSRPPKETRLFLQMANSQGDSTQDVRSGDMIFQPILEEGVFRFDCSVDDRAVAFPSVSFVNAKDRDTPIANVAKSVPSFIPTFKCGSGNQTVQLQLPDGTSFYGSGEVSGQLERTGKRVFTWNTDAWGYGPGTTSLYQSHPWVLAILPNGEAIGLLADTTKRCEIDLRTESVVKFIAPSSYPIISFGPFPSPTAVLRCLSHAIGTVFMPPKWSLGYQQCRWSYDSAKRVQEVAKIFREKEIPCDVIWMDIDYMEGFRCFTFDQERFPDPRSLTKDLHDMGFKAIWMLDPGIKREEGYFVYDSGSKSDVWVQNANGQPYIGEVWPGPCVFPDFTQSKVRSWWASLVREFVSNGVDGIWNDMNEPAVFKTVTKTMPETNIHRGDDELGGCQNHLQYHNVYGMLMARSTYEGMKSSNENKRPFVLTRAGFIGSQRYAATWTGDNLSNWEHLQMSIAMVLQLGLSGQPLSGPDLGGFAGNATPKLFGRWMGIGSLFPFCRGHSEKGTTDHEPWSFGEECEEVCRLALRRRYRLIPYIYTLFYMSHTMGTPVATPTFFADPKDPSLRKLENSFLLGSLLLCSRIYRPYTCKLIFAGKAEGQLFEDDGDGYGFTKGEYLLTHYVAELKSSVVTVKVSKTEGLWKRPSRRLHVCLLLGGGAMLDAWGTDGDAVQITIPSEHDISELVSASEKQYQTRLESAKPIPDVEKDLGPKGSELSKTPVQLKSGHWSVKIVPWIGGRIISMEHLPSGTQWLQSRIDIDGYEEYSGTEYRSAGCSEAYSVIERDLVHAGEEESLMLECDIGGGVVLQRHVSILKDRPDILQIESAIVARSVGAGSGGFSRLVCLRVHPTFTLLHPTETFVSFTSVDGSKHEIWPDSGNQTYQGDHRPNGEWMLVDRCSGLGLVNRFNVNEVFKCYIHWGTKTVNLELWSEDRPVSKQSPLTVSHQYEVARIASS
ncbi:Alpha-glucosidase 2 [Linum perenne]